MPSAANVKEEPFLSAFRGNFTGVLSWEDLDAFWGVVRSNAASGWYLYALGETPPAARASAEQVNLFISEIDALLRKEHQEDYCGIVYADNKTDPALIKIFDPNNLGVQCGFSDNPPLPGWVLSLLPPVALYDRAHHPENRKRWWRKLWD
ncbi:MAG: hypothetical protein NUV55_03735 [Sulfuricaulis sp.]|uniref:hypothetical protein n=1 Tax=Sulfuricaulis sp. TaxID=2003553 RepID=UPI0025D68016|nr:hypothetical protein [Sulfuricaulis sp.]MCR4346307.1 hypothetical protein [Sulfuricaulis sp.]